MYLSDLPAGIRHERIQTVQFQVGGKELVTVAAQQPGLIQVFDPESVHVGIQSLIEFDEELVLARQVVDLPGDRVGDVL